MDQEGWKDASAASAAAMSAHGYLACHVITGFTATIHKSRPVKEFTFSQLGCGDQRSQESQRLLICALAKLSLLFFFGAAFATFPVHTVEKSRFGEPEDQVCFWSGRGLNCFGST